MGDLLYLMMTLGAICLLLGLAYPVACIVCYPVYRAMGGKESLREWLRCM